VEGELDEQEELAWFIKQQSERSVHRLQRGRERKCYEALWVFTSHVNAIQSAAILEQKAKAINHDRTLPQQ